MNKKDIATLVVAAAVGFVSAPVVVGYIVDHSTTMNATSAVETEYDRLDKAAAIISTYTHGKDNITTKEYISMMEEIACVEKEPRIRYYQGQEIKCKR